MKKQSRKPLPIRELRAQMELKEISLEEVSTRAGVSYTTASAVLNARVFYREAFFKLKHAIEDAPDVFDHFPQSIMEDFV